MSAQNSSVTKSEYFPIPINLYKPGDLIEEDLYFLYQGNYLLYRLKNLSWKPEDRLRLEEFGVNELYIRCDNNKKHHHFLEVHLHRIMETPDIPSKEKAQILYLTSASLVEEIFDRPQSADHLRRSVTSVKHSIDYLSRDKNHFFELMALASKNFSEFTHGLHTAAYAITLAQHLGIKAFNQVSGLGIAAILHDIGKVKVDKEILEKGDDISTGSLTESEKTEIEKHPQYGYELMRKMKTIPEVSETVILEHHEKPNGHGYPRALSDDIHMFSKILAICDVFDSLTSERPFRKAMKPIDAIEFLRTQAKEEYDQNLLIAFVKMLKR